MPLILHYVYFRQAATSSILPVTSLEDDSEDQENSSGPSEEEDEREETAERLPNPLAGDGGGSSKLPPPMLGGNMTAGVPGSVFLNPFLKAEKAKQSVLEKHVKMTNYVEEEETKAKQKKRAKDKRKLCHKFIKGNCRYGHKCRFSHDLGTKSEKSVQDSSNTDKHANYGNRSWHEEVADASSLNDDDSYMAEAKKKKRPAVTDHLVPPKKAMKALDEQRATERPWTVQN